MKSVSMSKSSVLSKKGEQFYSSKATSGRWWNRHLLKHFNNKTCSLSPEEIRPLILNKFLCICKCLLIQCTISGNFICNSNWIIFYQKLTCERNAVWLHTLSLPEQGSDFIQLNIRLAASIYAHWNTGYFLRISFFKRWGVIFQIAMNVPGLAAAA